MSFRDQHVIYLLPHIIERAAERFPDQDAFRCEGEGLSYAELLAHSNSLAHLLIDHGVLRGDRVGICMPRCLESAVAIYGIMQAGAAYVPIDPHTPLPGVQRLITDCGIRHLIGHRLTHRTLSQLAAEGTELNVMIGIDDPQSLVQTIPWNEAVGFHTHAPTGVGTMEHDPAYIMYSSGSTGRPKGIMHTHRSGLSYAELSVRTYEVSPDDRIGNHSPLHFDMSTFGYFSGPFAGATTVLIPEPYTKIPASLSQLMESERLTIWYSVPGALIHLLARGVLDQRNLDSLRWVLFGGEPFAARHVQALMEHWPQAAFSNVYGPAEVNQCTYYHVPKFDDCMDRADIRTQVIPIGRVWDNTEGIVLDEYDQPVPAGQTGELMIRSPTMMHGYWNRPDLNANSFFRQTEPGGFTKTFYRTGDLVQLQDDGNYLFLGRRDRQIKTRGHRVELDDVESCLTAHPDVLEAAAFPVADDEGHRVIHSAVTTTADSRLTPEILARHLRDSLPPYAVPETIVVRDVLPRTATGKIDRTQLQQEAEHSQHHSIASTT